MGKPIENEHTTVDTAETIGVEEQSVLHEETNVVAADQSKGTTKRTVMLFIITAALFALWLIPKGTMINVSGDAASIWQTIKTFYTDSIAPSYVLYKGPMSVYPYVWMYQLAVLFGTNEFFFIMIYHAVLFSYIVTIGIPNLVTRFFKKEFKLWQNLLLIIWLFGLWEDTHALDQMMVDLPSCAFLLLSIQLAQLSFEKNGWKKVLLTAVAAGFSALVCVISGQYVVAGWCVICYMILKLCPWEIGAKGSRRWMALLCTVVLAVSVVWPYAARDVFDEEIVEPLRDAGEWIPSGQDWMERSIMRSVTRGLRNGWNPGLTSSRGYQILVDYFGSEELANTMLKSADNGAYGWSVKQWFSVFAKYPFDFFITMMDKVFVMLSITGDGHEFSSMEIGYILLFMGLYALIKQVKKLNALFTPECLLGLAPVAAILPQMAMGLEMRFALSLHALVYGVAILGPTFSEAMEYIKSLWTAYREKKFEGLREQAFPWPAVMCLMFVLLCNSHIGALYAQSGAAMLFQW